MNGIKWPLMINLDGRVYRFVAANSTQATYSPVLKDSEKRIVLDHTQAYLAGTEYLQGQEAVEFIEEGYCERCLRSAKRWAEIDDCGGVIAVGGLRPGGKSGGISLPELWFCGMIKEKGEISLCDHLENQPSYKDRFTRIKPHAIELTRELIKAKPWRGNPGRGEQEEFLRAYKACLTWLKEMSALYHIPMPHLFITDPIKCGAGCYNAVLHAIFFPKFSVTTLAHEFRHALQFKKFMRIKGLKHAEKDARGWSVSLIYRADPKFCERAKRRGLLLYT